MAEPKTIRQSVSLSTGLAQEIQRLYLERNGSAHGAMQEALARGAELVLQELRGGSPAVGVTPTPTDEEFVKCPARIRSVVQTAIARLLEMDPNDLPRMEHLIVRFSQPGYIDEILAESAKTVVTSELRAVPTKSKGSGQS